MYDVKVDWTRRAAYIKERHDVETNWADEAVRDEHAVWIRPDPASKSGFGVRVIGYSRTAGQILTVILVSPEADPNEPPDGDWWGSNAWPSSDQDQQIYAGDES